MDNIVTDFIKCVTVIESCETKKQLNNCYNLSHNFRLKHARSKTVAQRRIELDKLIHSKLMAS